MAGFNFDFTKTIKSAIPTNTLQPRRSQIYVGFQCHQGCGFCYYKNQCLTSSMLPIEQIKSQIDFKIAYGIHDFEITGGEPGEFPLLLDVCRYIRDICPIAKIAVISNGSIFTFGPDLFKLIDEVLLSYHCSRNSCVDKLFFPNGCTWNKIQKSTNLAKEFGCMVRTNTVIGTFNLSDIDNLVQDLCELEPKIINFLPVNLFDQADDLANFIDYTALRTPLKRAITTIKEKNPKTLVYARYMPFCDMEGYEKHIVGHLQHIYDWFDWNVELGGAEIISNIALNGAGALQERLGSYGSHSIEEALSIRKLLYSKPKKCLNCKFQLICDGFEKQIPLEKQEEFAVLPNLKTTIIKNPLEFSQLESSKDLYTNWYN